jgi:hypothetical protein
MRKVNKRNTEKGRGRPATGQDPVTAIRLAPDLRGRIDQWSATQEDLPTRSEAIRRLVTAMLEILAKDPDEKPVRKTASRAGRASEASAMAGCEIDRLGDKSAPVEEQERRKRRLIKGPTEFREMRGHLPNTKR